MIKSLLENEVLRHITIIKLHVAGHTAPPGGRRQQEDTQLSTGLMSGTTDLSGRFNQLTDPGKRVKNTDQNMRKGRSSAAPAEHEPDRSFRTGDQTFRRCSSVAANYMHLHE